MHFKPLPLLSVAKVPRLVLELPPQTKPTNLLNLNRTNLGINIKLTTMKYIIRFIAAIPMLTAAISTITGFVFTIDYPIIALYAIGSIYTTAVCIEHYENTVRTLINVIRVICNKTPCYDE